MSSRTTIQTELRPLWPETYLRLLPQLAGQPDTRDLLDLPTEIIIIIVSFVPPTDLGALRQTCRRLNMLASKRHFSDLTAFLSDDVTAQQMLESASWAAMMATKSIWSPRCLAPKNLEIKESWILAAYAGAVGESWCLHHGVPTDQDRVPLGNRDVSAERHAMLGGVFEGLGRQLDEAELKAVFWQFCLYMSYCVPQRPERSELLLISAALWR